MVSLLTLTVSLLSLVVRGAPVQLVRPARDHARLEAVTDGLEALRKIQPPISIISAVGAVHSGKSFLLNRLLDSDSPGFAVGYSIRPETHGIWMDEAREKERDVTILFLDTEGFFSPNVTDTYDAKMFAIATLLSSEVIYNTVKFIDNHHVELLELLIRRTNLFGLRAYARHTYQGQQQADLTAQPGVQTPSPVSNLSAYLRVLVPSRLSWVVQDFVQDLGSLQPEDWLRELVTRDRKLNGHHADSTSSVGTFFKQIDCVPLPVPAGDSETLQKLDRVDPRDLDKNYVRELNAFRRRLFLRARLHPKVKGGSKVVEGGDLAITPMTGGDLADLLEFLVEAANIGTENDPKSESEPFPQLPSIAEQFTSLQLRLMKSDILNILDKDLTAIITMAYKTGLPLKRSLFVQETSKAEQQAIALWNSTVKGLVSSKDLLSEVSAAERDFSEGLITVRNKTASKNCELITMWCNDFSASLLEELEMSLNAETPVARVPSQLDSILVDQIDPIRNRFQKIVSRDHREWTFEPGCNCCRVTLEDFDQEVKNITSRVKHRNNKLIEEEFEAVTDTLVRNFKLRVAKKKEDEELLRQNKGLIDRFFEAEKKSLLKDYEEGLFKYRSMPLMPVKRQHFTRHVDSVVSHFVKEWHQKCQEEAEQFLKSASLRYPFNIRRLVSLPAEEEVLLNIIQHRSAELTRDFQQTVFCHDSNYGAVYVRRLNDLLEQTKTSVITQNVQTLKEISGQPLRDLQQELMLEAPNFYVYRNFESMARKRAIETLQNAIAQYEQDGSHTNSPNQMSITMIRKVAQSFVGDDLKEAQTIVYSSLLWIALIIALFGCTGWNMLKYGYNREWWDALKWGLGLGLLIFLTSTAPVRSVFRTGAYKFAVFFQTVLPGALSLTVGSCMVATVVYFLLRSKPQTVAFYEPPPATHTSPLLGAPSSAFQIRHNQTPDHTGRTRYSTGPRRTSEYLSSTRRNF